MSIGRLKALLESSVPPIERPDRDLEQYTTPAEIALAMASWAREAGVLEGSVVADLGAGTCRIAIAALLLGASKAVAVDVDERLAAPCLEASRRLGLSDRLSYVVSWISSTAGPLRLGAFDLIMTNPPFGVWRRGADREFLTYAMSLRPRAIIAVVKSGNLDFHGRLAMRGNYRLKLIGEFDFPIPASMPHHRSRIRRVKVDVIELSGE
ncbi:MAG: METTL5 family protein [Acidilobus sp.]